MSERPRIAVTGMGLVSAVGWTLAETWAAIVRGQSGLRALSLFASERWGGLPVGEVVGDPAEHSGLAEGSRSDHLALWAAGQAVADAGWAGVAAARGAVVMGAPPGASALAEESLAGLARGQLAPARLLD